MLGLPTNALKSASQALARVFGGGSSERTLAEGGSAADRNAIWSLELWENGQPISGASWTFRWPPSQFSLDQSIRADVGLDLVGQTAASYIGPGMGRLSLSGSHGVRRIERGEVIWEGVKRRDSLMAFFADWESRMLEANKSQGTAARYPDMVLCVRRGTASEWENAEFLVWPLGFPTDERDASKPLDWRYAMSFWVLGHPSTRPAPPVPELSTFTAAAEVQAGTLGGWLADLAKTGKEIVDFAKAAQKEVADFQTAVQDVRAGMLSAVSRVRETLHGLTSSIESIEKALDARQFARATKGELCRMRRDLVALHGVGKRLVTHEALRQSPKSLAPASAAPLPTMAARALGDASRWREIASLNGLSYPYQPSGPVDLPR